MKSGVSSILGLVLFLLASPVSAEKEPARICFHDKVDYDGAQFCSIAGHAVPDTEKVLVKGRTHNWYRRIRSIRVYGDVKAVVFDVRNYLGNSLVLTRSEPDLSRVRTDRGLINWSNLIASYKTAH